LDCQLCLGFISFNAQDWEATKLYFDKAYFIADKLGEGKIAE